MRAAGFERDVKCRPPGIVPAFLRVPERLDFRVRQTRAPMPATPDDFAVFHQYRANHRVRGSRAVTASGEAKGEMNFSQIIQTVTMTDHGLADLLFSRRSKKYSLYG